MHRDTYRWPDITGPEAVDLQLVSAISKVGIVAANLPEKDINPELATETSKLPKFGDEESYHIIFRMFCAGDNAGSAILTVEEVWNILDRYCDMSDETLDSLSDTLHMFASDIKADAEDRGLIGRFCEIAPGSFVFALHPSQIQPTLNKKPSAPKQTTPVKQQPTTPPVIPQQAATKEAATGATSDAQEILRDEYSEVHTWVKGILYQEGKNGVRQPVLRKLMIQKFPGLADDQTLGIIDQLVEAEELFKYSPQQAGAKWLTLDPVTAQSHSSLKTIEVAAAGEHSPQSESLKSDLVFPILKFMITEHTHANQRTPSGKLLQRLKEDYGIICDKATLNTTLRRLSAAELLSLDQGSPTPGRRKQMSKGKSQQVMRTNIASQEIKDLLRNVKDASEFRAIVTEHLEKHGLSLDDTPLASNQRM